jgi:N-acyl-D-amino-acid deacylase
VLDLLIKNGKLIDGTGNTWYKAEIGVKCGKIVKIARKIDDEAVRTFDAAGLTVTPGFIDIHSHSDVPIVVDQRAQSKLQQGVTTELTGQCGHSAAPAIGGAVERQRESLATEGFTLGLPWASMGGYLDYLAERKPANNQAILAGHGTIRSAVFGFAQRDPSTEELAEMRILMRESMKDGAFGISTGFWYAPGSYAKTQEGTELCKIVAELGGINCSHIRDESDYNIGLIAAMEEVIEMARGSGVSTQVAHLKALGPRQWGLGVKLLEMIDAARDEGLDVTFDQYPYLASSSGITGALLPRWAQEGGRTGTLAMLADPEKRKKIFDEMCINMERRGGADKLLVSAFPPDRTLQGKTLKDVGEMWGVHPMQAAISMLEKGNCSLVCFVMSDKDLETIMRHPAGMVGSDGSCLAADGPLSISKPHPRNFGTFPRVLSTYVREKKVIGLEEAIRKMTSAPAKKMGLSDRGQLREGNWADIVVFDAGTIRDTATFDDPKQYPVGIKWVIVNGVLVIEDGQHKGVFPGHVLRKKC